MLYLQERGLSPPHCTQENHSSIILSINPEMTDARTCTATAFQSVFFFLLLFPFMSLTSLHYILYHRVYHMSIYLCKEILCFCNRIAPISRQVPFSKGYFITMNHKTSGSACCSAKQPPNRDGRTRTLDTLDISQLLYPTELRPRGFPAGVTVQRGLKYIRRSIQRSCKRVR